jgi:hypothetical protein
VEQWGKANTPAIAIARQCLTEIAPEKKRILQKIALYFKQNGFNVSMQNLFWWSGSVEKLYCRPENDPLVSYKQRFDRERGEFEGKWSQHEKRCRGTS